MRRKSIASNTKKENRKIDKFLSDLFHVFKRHKMSLALKDKRMEFIVTDYDKENIAWLNNAIDGMYVEPPKENTKINAPIRKKDDPDL